MTKLTYHQQAGQYIGRFWRVTSHGIFLYWHTGWRTVARFNVTKQEAIEWEARMTAKEKKQNEGKKRAKVLG